MVSEDNFISNKTWLRSVDSVNKVGYMDGASEGQKSTFQSSFDKGFEQGLNFGFDLGYHLAQFRSTQQKADELLLDPRKINCQICLGATNSNVVNLYNKQKEHNDQYINTNFKPYYIILFSLYFCISFLSTFNKVLIQFLDMTS